MCQRLVVWLRDWALSPSSCETYQYSPHLKKSNSHTFPTPIGPTFPN